MKNPLAGFTVIEVMIFLAVSAVMFVAAVGVFSGRSQQTQFTQAMQDLQSQFRTYANQVRTSYLAGLGEYSCRVGSSITGGTVRPVLTKTAGATTNEDCVLLGRAIQVIPSGDTLYSYPIFGLRNIHSGSVNTQGFPTSVDQAAPEPAINGTVPPSWFMVEPYRLAGGFTVNKTSLTTAPGKQDLFMLYSSLQNSNTTGNEINAFSQGVNFNNSDIQSSKLKNCIEGLACGAMNAITNGVWKLCLQNNGKFGELQIHGTPTGITTSLNMDGCT
jgi:Tfp pilus assembly protein PilE